MPILTPSLVRAACIVDGLTGDFIRNKGFASCVRTSAGRYELELDGVGKKGVFGTDARFFCPELCVTIQDSIGPAPIVTWTVTEIPGSVTPYLSPKWLVQTYDPGRAPPAATDVKFFYLAILDLSLLQGKTHVLSRKQ